MRWLRIIFSIVIVFTAPLMAQYNQSKLEISRWGKSGLKNYIYTPNLVSVAINLEEARIAGTVNYTRTTISDTNGTKYQPQLFTVIVGVDSLPGLNAAFYDLEENTTYVTYQSLLQLNIGESTTYKKTADSTFTTPVGFNTTGTYTADGYRLYFTNGSRVILKQE